MHKSYTNSNEKPPFPSSEKAGWPWRINNNKNFEIDRIAYLPKISIITPSLNQGDFIEETIRSILLQNYPKLQYIIIDGGSTDQTLEIIKKYEPWIDYWISEPDRGQSHALNKGLTQVEGEIVNWINSDDLLTQNALWTIAFKFQTTQPDIICGYYQPFSSDQLYTPKGITIYDNPEKTFFFGELGQPAMFYKTSTLKSLGIFDENLFYCMDLDMWARFLQNRLQDNIVIVDEVLANFRLHPSSKTVQMAPKFNHERLQIHLSLWKEGRDKDRIIERIIKSKIPLNSYPNQTEKNIYKFSTKKVKAFTIELLIEFFFKYFSIFQFLKLFYLSMLHLPFGRRWRFYLLPFRRIKWIFSR